MTTKAAASKVAISPARNSAAVLPPDQSVGYLVREAHRAFLRALGARVSRHRVSVGMWYFLRALWEEDGLTQRELSRRVSMMEPTTATALESMERRGLISRTRNAKDRRKVNIRLTEEGRRLREVLLPYAIEVNRVALAGIPGRQIPLLREQLARIKRNLGADALADAEFPRHNPATAGRRTPLREARHKD
ncbi:MAG TPA: MarR family transcriptional regulator [Candidatus Binataceae bacterium]|nr:MarR family transcriptional regulator [Candidatus Binataceae bacterium]